MKTKNKKIFVLLCLPVLLISIILPLCSFTTVYDTDYDVYSSISNACVPYTYKYGNTGSYFGLLNNCARCLIDNQASTIAQKKDSIKFTASDYYITSSYRISIDGAMSDFVSLDGGGERLSLYYKTTNKDKVYFPLRCYVENVNSSDDLTYGYYLEGGDGSLYLIDIGQYDVTCNVDFTYTWVDNNNGELVYASERMYSTIEIGSNNTNDGLAWVLRPYEFVEMVLREDYSHITENPNFIYGYCSIFDCNMSIKYKGTDNFISAFDGVMVTSNVYNTSGRYYNEIKLEPFTDELQHIYSVAYGKGFDSGVSSAPEVWGSLSDFLEDAIGGFLSFEFVEGVSLGGILSLFLGFILVFSFLKIFAGG